MTDGAAFTTGAATGGAAGRDAGGLAFAGALALVFGAATRLFVPPARIALALGLLARAAPFFGAARRDFVRVLAVVPALLPFDLGIYCLLSTRNASPP
jgi:hypothetical protein